MLKKNNICVCKFSLFDQRLYLLKKKFEAVWLDCWIVVMIMYYLKHYPQVREEGKSLLHKNSSLLYMSLLHQNISFLHNLPHN